MTDREMDALKRRLKSYVKDREENYIKWLKSQDAEVSERVKQILKRTSDEILKETTRLMLQFADNDGNISPAQMSLLVENVDMQYLAEKAKHYVELANKNNPDAFSPEANAEMKQYNWTMKVSRQELLRRHLNLEISKMTKEVEGTLSTYLEDLTVKELQRQAGILNFTISDSESLLNKAKVIANADFYGQTFSERLWKNSEQLMQKLELGISETMLMGKNPKAWSKIFRSELKDNIKNAKQVIDRLAVTEAGRVQIMAQEDSYRRNDFTMYEIITEPDACKICLEHNEQVYNTEDLQIGLNAPVWHPNCRCTTTPYVSDEDVEKAISKLESYRNMTDEELYQVIINKINNGEYSLPEGLELFKGENFKDITNSFKNSKLTKTSYVGELKEVMVNDINYKFDGEHVVLDYTVDEKAIAEYLSKNIGGEIYMLPRVLYPKNVRTPDYMWDDEKWDLKTIKKHSKNTVTTAVGNGLGQSGNIILNIEDKTYSIKDKLHELERIFGNHRLLEINKILILDKNELFGIFTRK